MRRHDLTGPSRLYAALIVAASLLALCTSMLTLSSYDSLRERAFDELLAAFAARPASSRIVVVDIDQETLEKVGSWPWSRHRLAAVLDAIADARPAVIGLDILIAGPDERSPAELGRRLSAMTADPALRELLTDLPDGDPALAAMLVKAPTVLGLALEPHRTEAADLPAVPVLARSLDVLPDIWRAAAVSGPPAVVARAAAGLGILVLPGDRDGRIRRVPLLALAGSELRPGLAAETVRVLDKSSAYGLTQRGVLRWGSYAVPLAADAMLRLVPEAEVAYRGRTISASDLSRPEVRAGLRDRIVLVGSSAPELGGLRTGSGGMLRPSVQIHAGAVEQLLSGVVPSRPRTMIWGEVMACVAIAVTALVAGHLPPLWAALVLLGTIGAWLSLSVALVLHGPILLDPLAFPAAAIVSYAIVMLHAASLSRLREIALRRRFEQHLPPEVVRRIGQQPSLLKLTGEEREVTIIFTDIEGFTAMTERGEPACLITMLDRYFDGLSQIVVDHGGMVSKLAGDGMCALFNAPLDISDHAAKAVTCAEAMHDFTERFRAEPIAKAFHLGRTRIGIETGPVIIGDVGGRVRLDYTAYGNAMNIAARLEAANKELGTSICIGAATARLVGGANRLRPLGPLAIRGRSDVVEVFAPWPQEMRAIDRAAHVQAMDSLAADPASTLERLAVLASKYPADIVLAKLIVRLAGRS